MRLARLVLSSLLLLSACRRLDREAAPQPTPKVAASDGSFRFSPRPNRASEIHFRPWSQAAFDEARRTRRPVLLSLAAVWCHWCHVLDETTLSDPRVIALLNERFIALRVDADQRPDVEHRYLLGGWPTVAFLDERGAILDGGTYVPPDRFLEMARGAIEMFAGRAPRRSPGGSFDPTRPGALEGVVEGVARSLAQAADLDNGGFGGTPKFPHGEAVVLLLDVGEQALARRALDAMLRLEDPVEGGFYRYATRADWSVPHYEKMLYGQADLLLACAHAARLLGDEKYAAAARRDVAWIDANLTAPDGSFYASQDADEAYSAADAAGRRSRKPPTIDRTLLVDRNARMIDALVAAAADLNDPTLLARARRAASVLETLRDERGAFFHARRPGQAPELPGLLADQAWAALALAEVAGAARLPIPTSVRTAIAGATAALADPRGGYFDLPAAAGPGLLQRREKVLDDNAAMARAQLALGDRGAAAKTLTAFAGSYPILGTEAAPYARAVNLLPSLAPPGP